MTKRHLSEQQKARIQALQSTTSGKAVRVVAQLGRDIVVEDESNHQFQVKLRQNLPAIVTGDWVIMQSEKDQHVVTHLLPRTNLIERPIKAGKLKPVAANIDQIFLMMPATPAPNALMLDRYFIHLEFLGIPFTLVINKTDLGMQGTETLLKIYESLGYNILTISCLNHDLSDIAEKIQNKTNILLGPSGVGKSSLVHALAPDLDIRIGNLSETMQGKHTTTTSRLYNIGDGEIIDSPGVYDIASWHLSDEQIRAGFVEFEPYKRQCQFNDCSHTHEPGCAVKTAVESGDISPIRYEHYTLILKGE